MIHMANRGKASIRGLVQEDKSFLDRFQSLGAGWLLGNIRELLAERVFEPLCQTKQLHSSKEGFIFHRPPPNLRSESQQLRVSGVPQIHSVGEHYDQGHKQLGLHSFQALAILED